MALYVASDGVIFKDELKAAVAVTSSTANESTTAASSSSSSSSSFSWKPVLILVPIRLGVDRLNAVYIPGLKSCFAARHCVGVAGGKPNSSYFFVGYSGEQAM